MISGGIVSHCRRPVAVAAAIGVGIALLAGPGLGFGSRNDGGGQKQVPATIDDFFQPGTQPNQLDEPFIASPGCQFCHGGYDDGNPDAIGQPHDGWKTSLMAQSARDPVWRAALTISNQDVHQSGEFCIRCHAPNAWLNGRSIPADGSDFVLADFDGVHCHFCHRMVDPIPAPENPAQDKGVLAGLMDPPSHFGNAQYIVDPEGDRRGPYDDVPMNLHSPDEILHSPFHRESALCGTCHDVSNPVFTRQPDGNYELNDLGQPHPTQNPHDMFPEQRTYSEWKQSQFANGGVVFEDGRFGGNLPDDVPIASCQDCHMPDAFGGGCSFWENQPFFARNDLGQHTFVGSNSWVLSAVLDIYGEAETGLTEENVAEAQERTVQMLQKASDMALSIEGGALNVRITNWTGHKLPTGYPEGRRMWINVKFLDSKGNVIDEHGAYDFDTAELNENDTKVYQAKMGLDEDLASQVNLPQGESFHLSLLNKIFLDNRIPPIGFTNAGFESVAAAPVNYTYEDGQHWDDTQYDIPRGAAQAVVTLYHQTSSKQYMEFLKDANVTDDRGEVAYNQWVKHGKSAPIDMDSAVIDITPDIPGDVNGDGTVGVADLLAMLGAWGPCPAKGPCAADLNDDEVVDVADLLILLGNWG